jgi:hypothetical protein
MSTNTRRSATSNSSKIQTRSITPEYILEQNKKRKNIINSNQILKKYIQNFQSYDKTKSFYNEQLFIASIDNDDIISKSLSLSCNASFGYIPNKIIICTVNEYKDKPRIPLFPLPPNIKDADNFYNNLPDLTTWLLSKIIHPIQINNNYKLNNNDINIKGVSNYEIIQTMFGFAQCCINNFWNNEDKESLYLFNILIKSIQNFLLYKDNININNDNLLVNKLSFLLEKRDNNFSFALQYRNLCNITNVSQIYNIFYELSTYKTDFIEKSVFPSLSEFILGLITQQRLTENGVKFEGIQEQLLRMIWERSLKYVSNISGLDGCFDKNELIKLIHQKSGIKILNSLKYWTFFTQFINYILNNPNSSLDSKFNILINIKNNIKNTNGLNTLSLIISPSIINNISDEGMAEILLIAMKESNKKRMVLSMLPLVSKTNCIHLQKLIDFNLNRVNETQNKINIIDSELSQIYINGLNKLNIYTEFVNKHVHIYSTQIRNEFILLIVSLFKNNDNETLNDIKFSLLQNIHINNIFGIKKFNIIIKYLHKYFNNNFILLQNLNIEFSNSDNYNFNNNGINKSLKKCLQDFCVIINNDDNNDKYNIYDSIEYIKLDNAILKYNSYTNNLYNDILSDSKLECFICCYDKYLVDIHNNLHVDKICSECKSFLNNCPLCRIILL